MGTVNSQGEEEEEDEYMHTGSMLHSHSLTRSGSHAALLAAGGTLSESESSAVQLAQCVHEVSVDDNFRFAPGRLVDALQPLSPTQVSQFCCVYGVEVWRFVRRSTVLWQHFAAHPSIDSRYIGFIVFCRACDIHLLLQLAHCLIHSCHVGSAEIFGVAAIMLNIREAAWKAVEQHV